MILIVLTTHYTNLAVYTSMSNVLTATFVHVYRLHGDFYTDLNVASSCICKSTKCRDGWMEALADKVYKQEEHILQHCYISHNLT